jgi:hypothetical protein
MSISRCDTISKKNIRYRYKFSILICHLIHLLSINKYSGNGSKCNIAQGMTIRYRYCITTTTTNNNNNMKIIYIFSFFSEGEGKHMESIIKLHPILSLISKWNVLISSGTSN